ncbi:fimbrial protein [Pyxidicoccus parkwayensis]|uniref:Fimbrial protein n=1 Tax=Pyxidicoccus parkwayensis TaxID=2813578 RepID=A0ABX7NZW5_9BACT|nr:fimbrial protein [Pyxidicoccus parkwaysis]QSQ23961.1 fimbrial protein [Pyxidicoccus parkwaysis]
MKCPKCGRVLDVTGLAPGSGITCACGNVTIVSRGSSRKTLYIILGAVAVFMVCPCVGGIMSAIAIPNFIKFKARSKQAECKMNLKAWYTAQKAHFNSASAYDPDLSVVGFAPERANRYAYFAGEGPMESRAQAAAEPVANAVAVDVDTFKYPTLRSLSAADLPRDVVDRLGLSGQCPKCNITLACAGNVDSDDTLDVWVISTGDLDLQDEDGKPVRAGVPANIVNDIRN